MVAQGWTRSHRGGSGLSLPSLAIISSPLLARPLSLCHSLGNLRTQGPFPLGKSKCKGGLWAQEDTPGGLEFSQERLALSAGLWMFWLTLGARCSFSAAPGTGH